MPIVGWMGRSSGHTTTRWGHAARPLPDGRHIIFRGYEADGWRLEEITFNIVARGPSSPRASAQARAGALASALSPRDLLEGVPGPLFEAGTGPRLRSPELGLVQDPCSHRTTRPAVRGGPPYRSPPTLPRSRRSLARSSHNPLGHSFHRYLSPTAQSPTPGRGSCHRRARLTQSAPLVRVRPLPNR